MLGMYGKKNLVFEQYVEQVHGEELRKSAIYAKRGEDLWLIMEFQWPLAAEEDPAHDRYEAYCLFESIIAASSATEMEE